MGLRARRAESRACWWILAVVVAFTSPWLAWLDRAWFGAFPTIDKEGSLLFFLDGVHRRLYLAPWDAPADSAVRLIGVHAGHLWLTEGLALVFSPMGAFNAQWLLQMVLGWGCAAWAIRKVLTVDSPVPSPASNHAAFVAGFPFGMGLHVFRDLDVTTVEKGGVAFIPLFIGCWMEAHRKGGRWVAVLAACYAIMALYNLYFAVVCAVFGALYVVVSFPVATPKSRSRLLAASSACAAVGIPVALAQLAIQSGGPALASPERFLWERAALDGFTLWPLQWNRLDVLRACNPVLVAMAGFGAWQRKRDRRLWMGAAVAAGLFVVSLGPVLIPGPSLDAPVLTNPVYMGLHKTIPGFWRLAKPEVFFQPVWWMTLAAAGFGLKTLHERAPARAYFVGGLALLLWWPLVRAHPEFPGMSAPVDSQLDHRWQDRVFSGE